MCKHQKANGEKKRISLPYSFENTFSPFILIHDIFMRFFFMCNNQFKISVSFKTNIFFCSRICMTPDALLGLALGCMLGSDLFYLFAHSPWICSHLRYVVLRTDGKCERSSQAHNSFKTSAPVMSPNSLFHNAGQVTKTNINGKHVLPTQFYYAEVQVFKLLA